MRRFFSSSFIVAGCCMVCGIGGSATYGRDDLRTSMFRSLTNEQPTAPPARPMPEERLPDAADVVPATTPVLRPAESMQSEWTPTASTNNTPLTSGRAPTIVPPPPAAPTVRPASFHGGNSARQTMSQFPRRASIRSNPQGAASRRQPKPFETAEHEPTISPYLSLDRDDNDTQDVPNYLTLVLPQKEQMQINRAQQREISQLRGQLQNMAGNVGVANPYDVNRSAGMGASARFMDTAQFYGGKR